MIQEYKLLLELKDILIKAGGILKGSEDEEERRKEEKIRDSIRSYIKAFIKRDVERICIPFTTKVSGFKGLLILFGSHSDPKEVCNKIEEMVKEILFLDKPVDVHEESVIKCRELAIGLSLPIGFTFTEKYMKVNRDLIYGLIVRLLDKGSIYGCLTAIEELIGFEGEDFLRLYKHCKGIKVGSNVIGKRFYALSRYLENLFLITGIAIHDEPPGLYKVGKGRRESYYLTTSPLTRSMEFFLRVRSMDAMKLLKLYMEAYSELSTCVIEGLVRGVSAYEIITRCSPTLRHYEEIHVDNDVKLMRKIVAVYQLLLSRELNILSS
jgi:hypothetical protein